jgi:hypothetical protein
MTTQPVSAAQLPPECAAADAALRAVLEATRRSDEWAAPTRQAVLGWLAKHRDLVAAVEAKVLTAEREARTWSLRGDRDLAGFVGRQTHAGRGAGMAAVAQAGTLAALPTVADALVDGPVTATHIAQITRATTACPALAAELATPAGQHQVVALARRLDGSDFGKALAQLSASLDPASRQRSHDEQRANRSFAWTHTPSGTLIKGRLDSVAGHKLAKVIDALCPRPALDDDRSREQRQADALAAMVDRVATDKNTTPGAVAPVQAVLTMTQETWAALRAEYHAAPSARGRTHRPDSTRDAHPDAEAPMAGHGHGAGLDAATTTRVATGQSGAPGSAFGLVGRLKDVAPVTDETGQAWPASEIARALCDCTLTRAVVGAPDVELNLGREARTFKRQHWLALYAAGVTGCSIDACAIPLAYTELHHIRWWYEHDGLTNIANCLPYCSFHHHEIHRNGISVTRLPGGEIEHRYPDGRIYGALPPVGAPAVGAPPGSTPPAGATPGLARSGAQPASGPSREPAAGGPAGDSRDRPPDDPPGDLLDLLSA